MEPTGDHLQYVDSYGLRDEEVERYLAENDVGVLALADGGRPYAVELRDPEGIDPATVNDWFGPARIFDEAVEAVEVRLYRFDVESAAGRRTLG